LATGLDEFGKSVSASKMITQISARLGSDRLSEIDKARLIVLSVIALEMSEKDRKAMTNDLDVKY
jgi:hypothetical protein